MAADLTVALLGFVAGLPIAAVSAYQEHTSMTVGLLLLAASCVPLVVRSRARVTALAATVAISELGYVLSSSVRFASVPTMCALYAVAAGTDRRTAWRAGTLAAVVLVVPGLIIHPGLQPLPDRLSVLGWTAAAVALGDAVRSRRELLATYQERAERAERTKEEEAQRRVTEERIRIARELHDVVAHHITLVNAQAGVAHHLRRTDPEQAFDALERIKDTSRTALDELRATVGLLRGRDDHEEPHEPAPGLADLERLVDTFRHAGLDVDLRQNGELSTMPSITQLTAYRIVQEALTNTHKHAAARTALVLLDTGDTMLTVTVSDDGTGVGNPPPGDKDTGSGYGMIGMNERARSAGGTLTAGPAPQGGFRVQAELPLRPKRASRDNTRPTH